MRSLKRGKPIVAIGLGYATKVLFDMVFKSTDYVIVAILDDDPSLLGKEYRGVRVIGSTEKLIELKNKIEGSLVCIGATKDTISRNRIFDRLEVLNVKPVKLIDKSAIVSSQAFLERGVQIFPGAVINAGASIGKYSLINTGAIVEHDCKIGKGVFIGPGAVLCGVVDVKDGAFVGAGSIIREKVIIGKNAVIGAGTVVIENVENGKKVVGVPAREIG